MSLNKWLRRERKRGVLRNSSSSRFRTESPSGVFFVKDSGVPSEREEFLLACKNRGIYQFDVGENFEASVREFREQREEADSLFVLVPEIIWQEDPELVGPRKVVAGIGDMTFKSPMKAALLLLEPRERER